TQPSLLGGQQPDPARMAKYGGRVDVPMIEGVLQRERVRVVSCDEIGDSCVQLVEASGQGAPAAEPDHTALDQPAHPRAVPGLDHAVAGDRGARVDAQDLHVTPSPPPAPRRRYRSWTTPWRRRPSLRAPRSARA